MLCVVNKCLKSHSGSLIATLGGHLPSPVTHYHLAQTLLNVYVLTKHTLLQVAFLLYRISYLTIKIVTPFPIFYNYSSKCFVARASAIENVESKT